MDALAWRPEFPATGKKGAGHVVHPCRPRSRPKIVMSISHLVRVLLLGLRQHLQPDVIASHLTVIGRPICTSSVVSRAQPLQPFEACLTRNGLSRRLRPTRR
jgi:hypothetical protein